MSAAPQDEMIFMEPPGQGWGGQRDTELGVRVGEGGVKVLKNTHVYIQRVLHSVRD